MSKIVKFAIVTVFLVIGCIVLFASYNWFSKLPISKVPVKLRIVNVLGPEEFKDAHIKGSLAVKSINVQLQNFESQVESWDKTIPVVTYCSNYYCMASGDAARRLVGLGFTDVYAYEAGMAEWYILSQNDKKYEVEGSAKKEYLNIKFKKPNKKHEGIRVISSEDLQKMIKKANLVDRL